MKRFLSKGDFLHVLIIVLINILLTDSSISTNLKLVFSVFPFFILMYLYMFKSKNFFYKVLICYMFSFPFGPRDIVLIQKGENLNNFLSFINFNIMFLSLSLFSIIFFTLLEILNLGLIKAFFNGLVLFIGGVVTYSLILNLNDFYFSFFISDLKPFLIMFFGYFLGLSIWKRFNVNWEQIFTEIIYFLLMVYAIKTLFYVFFDFLNGVYNTNFGTLPYFFIPVLFVFFFSDKFKNKFFLIALSLISSFSLSRGYFIMLIVLYTLLPLFFTSKKNLKKVFILYNIFFGLIFFLISYSHLFLSEKVNVFLQYKLNFFTNELYSNVTDLNRSTLIRVYEFKNIMFDLLSSPIYFFFGKGLGGYFQFNNYSLPTYLGVDAFSMKQIELNKFFRPHTFFNFALLKGGVFLLFIYSVKNLKIFLYSIKVFKKKEKNIFVLFSGFFSLLFIFFYWIPEFLFLNGLVFGYIKKYKK